jgi:Na+/melibiose symporter-like transporter
MKQKTTDNLIYLGVGGVIAAALAFYVFYTDRTMGRIPQIPGALLWGVLSTFGITALILERFWKHRRRRLLWVILIAVASINASAVVTAYSLHWNPPIVVWSTITGLSVVLVFVVADKLLAWNRNDHKSPR